MVGSVRSSVTAWSRWTWPVAAVCLLVVFAITPLRHVPARASGGPCDAVTGEAPHPPGGQPEPYIGGTVVVTTGGANTPVSGATLWLHRCNGQADTTVTSVTTGNGGVFTFSSLSGPNWYYVVADLTGPLAGRSPTATPALIGVGAGTNALNLTFQ
ncbi:MAG: hypothetical protein ABI780_03565 [Ardenticatenales bacterium]